MNWNICLIACLVLLFIFSAMNLTVAATSDDEVLIGDNPGVGTISWWTCIDNGHIVKEGACNGRSACEEKCGACKGIGICYISRNPMC